jgi:hypothetical protein
MIFGVSPTTYFRHLVGGDPGSPPKENAGFRAADLRTPRGWIFQCSKGQF